MTKNTLKKFELNQLKINDLDELSIAIFRELMYNYGKPFIWTISKNSSILNDNNQLKKFLKNDFGDNYILYLITYNLKYIGFVGITNLDVYLQGGELVIGIVKDFRKRHDFLIWWIYFLQNIQKIGIKTLYAKIKSENNYAFSLSLKFGFQIVKETSVFSNLNENSNYLSRTTSLIEVERKFFAHNYKYFV